MREKTILVTGGAGFIGSHLCEALLETGAKVISLDNYFTGSRDNHIRGVEYRKGHTRDIDQHVPDRIDLVYHLGEYARVERSLKEPDLVWDLNIKGTFAVLEYCRKRNTKIVYAGSSTKFGDGGLGRDQSPYAWTKASNTELVRNYGAWYKLPFAITYFYNVYGPRERGIGPYATLVAIFADQHRLKKPLTVVSPGTQKRNFTHVADIIEGLLLVGERGEGDDFGLGAKESYSVLEVARMFGDEIDMLPERAGNRMDAALDTTKSAALGWYAKKDLREYINTLTKRR